MLTEHEDSFQKPIKADNPGPVFIPCGNGVEGLLTVIKVRESALHVSARQCLGMVCGGIVTLTWIGREKTSKGRKSAFHAAFRTHVSCFQTSNALVR